jgi:hypothetical protein
LNCIQSREKSQVDVGETKISIDVDRGRDVVGTVDVADRHVVDAMVFADHAPRPPEARYAGHDPVFLHRIVIDVRRSRLGHVVQGLNSSTAVRTATAARRRGQGHRATANYCSNTPTLFVVQTRLLAAS